MGLGIYTDTVETAKLSQDATFTNPLSETIDGRNGGSIERRLYIRNDDVDFSYQDITLTPIDTEGVSIVDGTNGFAWKLRTGDDQPTDDEWALISEGNTINLSDLGTETTSDTSTYLPFWLRIEIPKNSNIQTYTDVQLQISAEAILI